MNNLALFTCESLDYTFNNISIKDFHLQINEKILFENSTITLSNNKYGLIGKNGMGKTTLLRQIVNSCNDDTKIRILYVEQELILDERNPIEYILDSNIKLKFYQDRANYLRENDCDLDELIEVENYLSSFNVDKEISIVKRILSGLGFTDLEKKCNLYSGGWQMRISLARSLYLEPDLLLLDEPTNHLDLEAIIWLSEYLNNWKKILIIISHNIGFLNNVCNYILNIENKMLLSYKGDYYKFRKAFEKKKNEMKNNYDKFEKKCKDLKKKNSKGLDEFIKNNKVIRPEKENDTKIIFNLFNSINGNLISLHNISFSYEDFDSNTLSLPQPCVLENISFGLDINSKITLVGLNGSGKSTLIKLIVGEIKPDIGDIILHNNCKIGYYHQHFDQQLPFDKTPIEFLKSLGSENNLEIIRSYLGKIKLESSAHTKLISELSGGQKARVAFIKLILSNPNFLLLDEPTNHLDIETVEILIDSLESFKGGILLITHEEEIIKRLGTKIYLLENKQIYTLDSYDDYVLSIIN
jgi:ATP-binding cassette subfamily F protein 1